MAQHTKRYLGSIGTSFYYNKRRSYHMDNGPAEKLPETLEPKCWKHSRTGDAGKTAERAVLGLKKQDMKPKHMLTAGNHLGEQYMDHEVVSQRSSYNTNAYTGYPNLFFDLVQVCCRLTL